MWFQKGCNKVAIELRVVQFWSEIILVISNQTRAACLFDFEITRPYDFRPNCTPLSSITIINFKSNILHMLNIFNLWANSLAAGVCVPVHRCVLNWTELHMNWALLNVNKQKLFFFKVAKATYNFLGSYLIYLNFERLFQGSVSWGAASPLFFCIHLYFGSFEVWPLTKAFII